MTRIGEAANRPPQADMFHGQVDSSRAHHELLRGLDGKQVCPFCGSVGEKSPTPCARCGMDNTPDARKATKARIGPWYVLQARNPAAPGMRFETLLSFVRKGRVRARSVVRGPTTHQLWRFAAHVKGLSREFGLCFSCGSQIETSANICPQCNRLQEPPVNPDVLLEDGSEDAMRPVYRELPEPPAPTPNAAAPAAPAPAASPFEPAVEDADIVIPALGGLGAEDLDSNSNEVPPAASTPVAPLAPAEAPVPLQSRFATGSPLPASSRPAAAPAAARATPEENPFAIAPARKKGNGDSAFLSAKELAAAFKLSFDPAANMDTVDVPDEMPASAMPEGMRPGAMVPRNPMGLAPPAAAPRVKRRGGFRKFVLFVLILAGTGFGVLLWVDAGFRQRTVEWLKETSTKLHRYATGAAVQPANTPDDSAGRFESLDAPLPPLPAWPTTRETSQGAPTEQATDSPAATVEPEIDDTTLSSEPGEPAETKLTPRTAPVQPPIENARPQASPPAPARSAAPAPAPAAAESTDVADDPAAAGDDDASHFKRMTELRKAAGLAERRGDYAAAVRLYEQIQKLPRSAWPTDLQVRLNYARKQLKK